MKYLQFCLFVLTLIYFISASATYGQEFTIEGAVTDTANGPLPSAHITVTNANDSTLVTYTTTDTQGKYALSLTQGRFVLTASYTGYRKSSQTLELLSEKKLLDDINFQLESIVLDDVLVEGSRPVTAKEDTLEFDAENFRTSADKNVEDLLEKIPGVEVRDNGKVYVRGQEIQDVLIEGTELYKNNPQLITRTLSADAINKVQIVDNYRPGGESIDRTAINLTIEEGKKNKLLGEITGGGGIDRKYLTSTNGYLINTRLKANFIGNFNNIGQQTFSLEDYLNFSGLLDDAVSNGGGTVRLEEDDLPIDLSEDEARPPAISIYTGALSLTYQPNPKWKARTYLIANQRRYNNLRRITRFFGIEQLDTPFLASDTATHVQETFDFSTSLTYQPKPQHKLRYDLRWLSSQQQRASTVTNRFADVDNFFEDNLDKTNHAWQHQFLWDYTIDANNILQWKTQINVASPNNAYQLRANTNPFAGLLPDTFVTDSSAPFLFNQYLQMSNSQAVIELTYKKALTPKLGLVARGGWSYRGEKTQHTFPTEGGNSLVIDSTVNRSNEYTFSQAYGEFALRYQQGIIDGQIGTSINWYQYDFVGQQNTASEKQVRLNPLARLNLQFAGTHRLNISYQLSNVFPNAFQLNEAFLVDDYRRLVRGNGSLQRFLRHDFSLLYYRYDLFHHINASALIQYRVSAEPIGDNRLTTLNADLLQPTNIQDESFLQAVVSLGKDFYFVPVSLKAEARYLQVASQNIFNSIINNFSTQNQEYKLSLSTRFKKGINATGGIEVKMRTLHTSSEQVLPGNLFYRPFLELDYDWSEKLSVSTQASYLSFVQGEASAQHFFFLNGQISYSPLGRFELTLETFNALNTNEFVEAQVSPFYTETTTQAILDRYFLASVTYSF